MTDFEEITPDLDTDEDLEAGKVTRYRFYLEYPTSTAKNASGKGPGPAMDPDEDYDTCKRGHTGNVLALWLDDEGHTIEGDTSRYYSLACSSATFFHPNSSITFADSVSRNFLRTYCKHVSKEVARSIHPRLFEELEIK